MAAPRATQFIALRNLARGSHQVRNLHMTGPASYSPVLTKTERPVMKPRDTVATEKRPTVQPAQSNESSTTRHFNTSRELKQVKDSSTIDFAYLPDVMSPENVDIYSQVRVPILPTFDNSNNTPSKAIEPEEVVVMKPQISSMSADAVYLPMADLSDGHSLNIDFHAMADRVAANLRRMSVPMEQQASIMKQIWNDMVDDAMGMKKLTV